MNPTATRSTLSTSPSGKAYLVGTDPGNPELLMIKTVKTVKTVKAIASGDVILVDDLVNPAVLTHAIAQIIATCTAAPSAAPSWPLAYNHGFSN